MATPPVWRPLPPAAGLPNLLVSTAFSTAEYTVHVTDLANIWVESLDRRGILMRSLANSTTIDPTESTRNMRAFLSKIRSVFDPTHPDHDKATLNLSTAPQKDAGEGGLTMHISCELDNMKPLVWPMYLQKCPQSTLATELTIPLTQANSAKTRQIDSLLTIMKQKDTVIMKLLDKLEATGTRLENVFTVLSAKQKPTRKMAEEKVKGLAPFSHDDWKAQLGGDDADIANLIRHVFGSNGLEYQHQDASLDLSLDDWWTTNESSTFPIVGPNSSQRQQRNSPEPDESRRDDKETGRDPVDDDDFQVQSTPPHLMSNRNRSVRATNVANDDDSTEDGDTSQIPDSVPVPPQEPKRHPVHLGTIGRKQQPTPSPPPAPEEPKPDGSETETESDDDATASVAEPSSPPRQPEPEDTKPTKVGLGRIGGVKRRSNTPEPSKDTDSPKKGVLGRIGGSANRSKSPEPLKKPGLGRIGGRAPASKDPETSATEAEDRGRDRTECKPQARTRETSQERANRKRDELQQELQRKAAAGPARKKRKF
ncbi:hypothetical protein COL26b_011536 [Colletotrichum chrysophilum]|uniref:uncharacterized protein n=1 Tax=Colletotrichum chrysophilum TaxID=1836956 RepID=UPI0023007C2A|nr:uncharacterized protein COL26b_011536 [Colletotrichum chrysophilum]KAJ0343468.1 hypothetical protein KNSL1_010275 [Colletotrichum chrysophilum]KAJ0366659.1 hypothetical protein COL26b_011536 [Colletotrichum chrysophilum]